MCGSPTALTVGASVGVGVGPGDGDGVEKALGEALGFDVGEVVTLS